MIARMPRQITSLFRVRDFEAQPSTALASEKGPFINSVEFSTEIGRADAPQPWKILHLRDMNTNRLNAK